MDTPDHKLADIAHAERHGFRVADDLADMPVSDAELDAVEAFLMAAFRAVMAGESPPMPKDTGDCDSNQPQTHADIASTNRVRRRAR
ncbi:MAG: hypothetical protein C0456_20225 [Hyphomonas sp.]|uniref:hypothetical protein n=1 Tax=Hyphomonas sp. TaxID=87 RepID=UPI001D8D3F53|nr:hypothetical protein [Hyphomonas sp.]MBA4174475.1 hypothetical protein [Hyphomicrobium sp.]MBA4228926.1 hypothetical protein [Hyphomonas sp.]